MLTPEQIAALRDAAGQVADPITEYLLADIARRIAEAGQLTSTAAYEVWRAQNLGLSQREIKKQLEKLLARSAEEIEMLMTQAAEVGYKFDLSNLPTADAIPFAQNGSMQQLVAATVALAQEDFTNLTQTLGMVDPFGRALPLQDVYRSCTDFAFKQVFTGAADYNTAIRQATEKLARYGLRTIDYESGVHTSMEAAVRRNIMGGIGLMQEQISQYDHDMLGADGWEISAHANSAPDHEPIQGKQYTDAQYTALNNSLVRRISTLNCGHVAFPIILGVSSPQYTSEELAEFREDNEKGVTYEGRHYTGYEATQQQRRIERAIRAQKRRVLVAENAGEEDSLLAARIRLTRLNEEYERFSGAAGLRTQRERMQVAGFGTAKSAARIGGRKSTMQDFLNRTSGVAKSVQGGTIKKKVAFQSKEALEKHFKKHQSEFGDITPDEYIRKANKLASMPISEDVERLTRSDGSVSTYRYSTNEFLVVTKDNEIRTYFKPVDKEAYWREEHDRNKE